MNLFHWLFGAPPADPAVGQVWRSENSGKCMRVEQVRRTDHGCLVVSTEYEYEGGWTTTMDHYVRNIAGWRRHLRNEKRVLVAPDGAAPPPAQSTTIAELDAAIDRWQGMHDAADDFSDEPERDRAEFAALLGSTDYRVEGGFL